MAAARFKRRNHGDGHSYTLDGEKVPGVTTVLGVLDKPALVGWAAKESAGYAIEHWDELAQLPLMKRAEQIEKARFEKNRQAIVRGHRIHEFGNKLAHGQPVQVPDEYRGPAEAYARFLDAWEIETVATETPVCHTEYRYAGTFDVIGRSPRLGQVMLDIKSGKAAYDETGLQEAAYRNADLMIDDQPMIDTDGAYVAHLNGDVFDLLPLKQDGLFEIFLYLLEIYEGWTRRVGWKFKNESSFDPVVGAAIYPDQRPADVARLAG